MISTWRLRRALLVSFSSQRDSLATDKPSHPENILISNSYPVHFDALVTNLQDSNSHVRALSYLIVRALLGHLSGGQQLDAAHKILKAMALDRLSGIEDLSAEVTLAAVLYSVFSMS